ncbi:MAG: nucleotidyltransferase family protein [Acidimicrobiia bacterium]|nr:nucleotidyltransferase family protein [Acidimicrobiia bacterium]
MPAPPSPTIWLTRVLGARDASQLAAVPAEIWPAVVERARLHGVLPLVADALRRAGGHSGVPVAVVDAARDAETRTVRRSLVFQSARAAALPRPASPPALAPKPIMH